MKDCLAKSVACIASIVQQLLQTMLAVLIDIYFKAKRSLAALVMTIIFVYPLHCCVRSDPVKVSFFTEKVQFDYVQLPNQSNNNPNDWVRLSSIDFWFGFL